MHFRLFRRAGRSRRRADGQGLVEFALILPVLMVIFMGILQMGFLLSGQIGLINSVREAARFGSTAVASDSATASTYATNICNYLTGNGGGYPGIVRNNVAGYNPANLVKTGGNPTKVQYTTITGPDGLPDIQLRVFISYRHPLFIPLVGSILDGIDGSTDNALKLTASEQMRVENPTLNSGTSVSVTQNCP